MPPYRFGSDPRTPYGPAAHECRFTEAGHTTVPDRMSQVVQIPSCTAGGVHIRLVANVDTSLEQQIFDLSQRQRVADIHHHHEADDLGRAVEIAERISHLAKLWVPFCTSIHFCLTTPSRPHNILDNNRNFRIGTLVPFYVTLPYHNSTDSGSRALRGCEFFVAEAKYHDLFAHLCDPPSFFTVIVGVLTLRSGRGFQSRHDMFPGGIEAAGLIE